MLKGKGVKGGDSGGRILEGEDFRGGIREIKCWRKSVTGGGVRMRGR